jgi:phosphoglucomutase
MNEQYKKVLATANKWLEGNYNEETKAEIRNLIENDEKGLIEAFYKNLEFGTGGLRGIMGAGTNRMNIYTVGMAAQGLANYTKKAFPNSDLKLAIAHDCRNNSREFSELVAEIFTASGFTVYLFEDLRPTPELSFAIRYLKCQTGIVITASHNPPEYNGFKAYWEDGSQLVAPHDHNVIDEVAKLTVDDVKFKGDKSKIISIGKEIDEAFLKEVKKISLNPEIIEKHKDLKIVYTPIHGTGVKMVPAGLKAFGFTNIIHVPEQDIVSGEFPTVKSPNPEEPEALSMAIKRAQETSAELVMASDPDGDRVGIAVRDLDGKFILLNGNQTGAIIIDYLISQWIAKGKIKGKEYIVKTIVTTELIADIANANNIEYFDTLTGFKNIAIKIRELEGKKTYIGGGEESYGYLIGEFVRDKDSVTSCALIAEIAAFTKENGKTLYEYLIDIYEKYGFYKEDLISIVRKGIEGAGEIKAMMDNFRNNPPISLAGSKIIRIDDILTSKSNDLINKKVSEIDMDKSNVLQYFTEDGYKVSVRPSGTEPKIKFYFSVKTELKSKADFDIKNKELDTIIEKIKGDLNLL